MPNIKNRRLRIKKGIRKKVEGTTARPRLTVFKSNRAIYAQVIDDTKGHTLLAASSKDLSKDGGVTLPVSKSVGQKVAFLIVMDIYIMVISKLWQKVPERVV
jgi:large subunit ribosomal protein L18